MAKIMQRVNRIIKFSTSTAPFEKEKIGQIRFIYILPGGAGSHPILTSRAQLFGVPGPDGGVES